MVILNYPEKLRISRVVYDANEKIEEMEEPRKHLTKREYFYLLSMYLREYYS